MQSGAVERPHERICSLPRQPAACGLRGVAISAAVPDDEAPATDLGSLAADAKPT